ncbi:hypothetical protein SAMN05192550_0650 [Flavobacterium glycines]|uniref:TonB C-terminal domain-containing protein n=1 Tax=Flavobacterium glycines TaxID=551990 RepID=A0A1B9DNP1_9FLAO|nr:hypothetical protein [Flavobacterium glycines]OCB71307.1 hypothetical protein FBGL_08645 [Flavobacterium glycines]GEL10318.1 hypothetical protein FGL01_10570 [Flavobacterium glycines]SDI72528.1 hypothetical protein SAMN05192550_0650 [Flavobacterium glycines]
MKKTILLTLILISISCKRDNFHIENKELNSGHLIYTSKILGIPFDFDVKFDDQNVRIYEDLLFTTSKITIVNKKISEVLHLNSRFALNQKLKESHFFYSSIKQMELLQMGSAYGDTIITKTNNYKNILGYKCREIIMNLGEQVKISLWTTDKIKTGIVFPNTPLTFDNETALEYEMKILGSTKRYYKIKSIENIVKNDKDFQHKIPDEYKLIVPISVFSLDTIWNKNKDEKKLKSFQYPNFIGGNKNTKKYFHTVLPKLIKGNYFSCSLLFTVNKLGRIEDLKISRDINKDEEIIRNELKNTKWIPAKVYGTPVNSEVRIYYSKLQNPSFHS